MKQEEDLKVEVKNREKVFFPDQKITKGDLIDYYDKIAEYILPFMKDRPLVIERFPDGIEEEGFFQKKSSDYFPHWIETVNVEKREGGSIEHVVCNNKSTLIYLVNQGSVTFHIWLSKVSDLNKPDKLVFDLDPPKGKFDLVIKGARALKKCLEDELGLNTFVMTSGSKGLHINSPIEATFDFEEVRSFAEKVASYVAQNNPDKFTTEIRKNKRKGRLFIDFMRNSYAQTSVSPYSVRAIENAPVATPLEWKELSKKDLSAQSYHIKNIFNRLHHKKKRSWDNFENKSKDLESSFKKIELLG